ncbi:hypothetical protein CDAR_212541 [Caerostris darwini]|uniref:Uncharacterized protein n=1 Tax=Caerostris darwini TaxID=1538125 RepID=A0AAV4PGQ1_9ARAC|nr:hypothetical protein CDAR_212541 [Caerostris darwini]
MPRSLKYERNTQSSLLMELNEPSCVIDMSCGPTGPEASESKVSPFSIPKVLVLVYPTELEMTADLFSYFPPERKPISQTEKSPVKKLLTSNSKCSSL